MSIKFTKLNHGLIIILMRGKKRIQNPLLDELEKGRWPIFMKDMKQAAGKSPIAKNRLDQR
jgi:hypothetical protein